MIYLEYDLKCEISNGKCFESSLAKRLENMVRSRNCKIKFQFINKLAKPRSFSFEEYQPAK